MNNNNSLEKVIVNNYRKALGYAEKTGVTFNARFELLVAMCVLADLIAMNCNADRKQVNELYLHALSANGYVTKADLQKFDNRAELYGQVIRGAVEPIDAWFSGAKEKADAFGKVFIVLGDLLIDEKKQENYEETIAILGLSDSVSFAIAMKEQIIPVLVDYCCSVNKLLNEDDKSITEAKDHNKMPNATSDKERKTGNSKPLMSRNYEWHDSDYGYVANKPIIINNHEDLKDYLDSLTNSSGEKIKYKRKGVVKSGDMKCEKYKISAKGMSPVIVYFYIDERYMTSYNAPKGFRINRIFAESVGIDRHWHIVWSKDPRNVSKIIEMANGPVIHVFETELKDTERLPYDNEPQQKLGFGIGNPIHLNKKGDVDKFFSMFKVKNRVDLNYELIAVFSRKIKESYQEKMNRISTEFQMRPYLGSSLKRPFEDMLHIYEYVYEYEVSINGDSSVDMFFLVQDYNLSQLKPYLADIAL